MTPEDPDTPDPITRVNVTDGRPLELDPNTQVIEIADVDGMGETVALPAVRKADPSERICAACRDAPPVVGTCDECATEPTGLLSMLPVSGYISASDSPDRGIDDDSGPHWTERLAELSRREVATTEGYFESGDIPPSAEPAPDNLEPFRPGVSERGRTSPFGPINYSGPPLRRLGDTRNPYTYLAERFAAVGSPADVDWSRYWLGDDEPDPPPLPDLEELVQGWPLMPLTADQVRALTVPDPGPTKANDHGESLTVSLDNRAALFRTGGPIDWSKIGEELRAGRNPTLDFPAVSDHTLSVFAAADAINRDLPEGFSFKLRELTPEEYERLRERFSAAFDPPNFSTEITNLELTRPVDYQTDDVGFIIRRYGALLPISDDLLNGEWTDAPGQPTPKPSLWVRVRASVRARVRAARRRIALKIAGDIDLCPHNCGDPE